MCCISGTLWWTTIGRPLHYQACCHSTLIIVDQPLRSCPNSWSAFLPTFVGLKTTSCSLTRPQTLTTPKCIPEPKASLNPRIRYCCAAFAIESESRTGMGASGKWLLVAKKEGDGWPPALRSGIAHCAIL